jgi:predicted MFS family arabinose efflux permease
MTIDSPVDLDTAMISSPDTLSAAVSDAPPASAGRDRVLPALCLASFVAPLAFIAPSPLFPDMSRDLGVSVPLLGQMITGMLLLSVPLALITGPLADRHGHRRLIVIGLVASALSLFTLSLAQVFAFLPLASVFGALAEACVLGLSLSVAGTHFQGDAARRAIGWTIGALASVAIVGVPIVAVVSQVFGWRVAILGAGLLAVCVAALAARWLPNDGRHPAGGFWPDSLTAVYRPLFHNQGMRRLYGASTFRAICWTGTLTYLGAFLSDKLVLSTGQIGLVYMVGGVGYVLGSLLAGGPLGRIPARMLIASATLVMALSLGLILSASFGTAVTIALLSIASLAAAIGPVGTAGLLTAETPAGTGATMTVNSAFNNLGAAGGGAIGGLLLAIGGYSAMAIGLPIFAMLAAALVWRR